MQGLCKKAKEMHQLNPEVDVTMVVKLSNGNSYAYNTAGDVAGAVSTVCSDVENGKCIQLVDGWFSVS